MADSEIRFDDGAGYEQMMGKWSQLAGATFLDWVSPARGQRWVDIGCGNGAFTQKIVDECAPAAVEGIDPSEGQLAFARSRPAASVANFRIGSAMDLPWPDDSFDVAVMALVLFFVPGPARGVAEMARVVRPGGLVTAYAWDILGGGFPLEPLQNEMRAMGMNPPLPPSVDASRIDAMNALWTGAGLVDVETREIEVHRAFDDFEDYWSVNLKGSGAAAVMEKLPPERLADLKQRTRARLPADVSGRILCSARANAVKGRVPG